MEDMHYACKDSPTEEYNLASGSLIQRERLALCWNEGHGKPVIGLQLYATVKRSLCSVEDHSTSQNHGCECGCATEDGLALLYGR